MKIQHCGRAMTVINMHVMNRMILSLFVEARAFPKHPILNFKLEDKIFSWKFTHPFRVLLT